MTTVNVYLNFDGNCEEAFTFYKSVFGGEFNYFGRFSDMPPSEDADPHFMQKMADRIMHVSLPISAETTLMGSDTGDQYAPELKQGNNFSISVNADSKNDADRLFNALSAGGRVNMPMTTTFWGAYFGMLTDKFGINWMMNFDENPAG